MNCIKKHFLKNYNQESMIFSKLRRERVGVDYNFMDKFSNN